MDTFEIDAICIRSVDYLENDKSITLYGTDVGKLSMVAKGAKKPKAKLKYAASPLCFLPAEGKIENRPDESHQRNADDQPELPGSALVMMMCQDMIQRISKQQKLYNN